MKIKRGRPPIPVKDRRTYRLVVVMTQAEAQHVRDKAKPGTLATAVRAALGLKT